MADATGSHHGQTGPDDDQKADAAGDDQEAEAPGLATRPDEEPIEGTIEPDSPEGIASRIAARVVRESYAGQFPHPDHLERFAALYPDAPKIIFDSFHDQGQHRRKMEDLTVKGNERRASIGQWLAYSLVLGAFALGLVCIVSGQAGTGATIIVAAFAGGVILYVGGGNFTGRTHARSSNANRRSHTKADASVQDEEQPDAATPGGPELPDRDDSESSK